MDPRFPGQLLLLGALRVLYGAVIAIALGLALGAFVTILTRYP